MRIEDAFSCCPRFLPCHFQMAFSSATWGSHGIFLHIFWVAVKSLSSRITSLVCEYNYIHNDVTLGKLTSQNWNLSIYKIELARIHPHLIIVRLIWDKWYNILSIASGIILDLWCFLIFMVNFFMLSTGQMQKYNKGNFELII